MLFLALIIHNNKMINGYTLRKAIKEDHDLIYDIKKNSLGEYITLTWGWDEELQRKMHENEMKTENIFLIQFNDEIIGTVGINNNNNEIIVSRMYIVDKFQSKGFGSRIIKEIIEENPAKKIKLGVLKVNPRAKKMYERLGFKIYHEENEHYRMILNRKP
jgi:RimJ/RimL family protein N-acetyltransferase